MTSFDLIWRLIELLLKDKETNSRDIEIEWNFEF